MAGGAESAARYADDSRDRRSRSATFSAVSALTLASAPISCSRVISCGLVGISWAAVCAVVFIILAFHAPIWRAVVDRSRRAWLHPCPAVVWCGGVILAACRAAVKSFYCLFSVLYVPYRNAITAQFARPPSIQATGVLRRRCRHRQAPLLLGQRAASLGANRAPKSLRAACRLAALLRVGRASGLWLVLVRGLLRTECRIRF
jgi:hypothetical protein